MCLEVMCTATGNESAKRVQIIHHSSRTASENFFQAFLTPEAVSVPEI